MQKILILVLSIMSVNVYYAKAYILMDMESKRVLKGENINTRYLTASIAKVLTAYVVIKEANLDDYVVIDEEVTRQEGSSLYLKEKEEIQVIDLLYGLILRSGNDAAYALAKHVGGSEEGFAFLMNHYAKVLGMKNSTFENASGLDSSSTNYSTPYDMALLMSTAYENSVFQEIIKTRIYNKNGYVFINKHRLVKENALYTGGKTGYTKKSGRTLITTARKNNKNLVVVTFNDSNDWNTHKDLFNYGFNNFFNTLRIKAQDFKSFDGKNIPYLKEDIKMPYSNQEKIDIQLVSYDNKYYEIEVFANSIVVFSKRLSVKEMITSD